MKDVRRVKPREITDRHAFDEWVAPTGRHVEHGDEVTVDGIRGRCVFIRHVIHDGGAEWVDLIVARTGRARTVRPDAVRHVHRKART